MFQNMSYAFRDDNEFEKDCLALSAQYPEGGPEYNYKFLLLKRRAELKSGRSKASDLASMRRSAFSLFVPIVLMAAILLLTRNV
jgi:hypothetical protein